MNSQNSVQLQMELDPHYLQGAIISFTLQHEVKKYATKGGGT